MTTHQAQEVQRTFQLIAHIPAQTVGQLFYERLFETAPDVRPLFSRTALPEQSAKLVAMLTYVIQRLDRVDSLVDDIRALARRHERYGVQEQHYLFVGQALLWTLEQALDADWTPDVKDAWVACYSLLSDTMINATRTPLPVSA